MKVCVTTVVDRNYIDYVPFFKWCMAKSYPDYGVVVLIKENEFGDCIYSGYNTIALRFLTGSKPYAGYDYVYITDIDMMILPEAKPLHKFHLDEMAKTGLPYSNSLRNHKHWEGEHSLTGLHFCSIEWFDLVEKEADVYRQIVRSQQVRREYDGWMLYHMCHDSGIGLPGKYPLVVRHHGIHLGNFRLFEGRKRKLEKRMDKNKCRMWLEYIADPHYREMIDKVTDSAVRRTFNLLEEYCRGFVCH